MMVTEAPFTIEVAGRLLRKRSISARELLCSCLERIKAHDGRTDAVIALLEERALKEADVADDELGRGIDHGPLHGIPYGVKDIFDAAGTVTSAHSRVMQDHVADTDSYLVSRLAHLRAPLLAKLATHEFALGGPSFDLPFPPARNPWDVTRQPGASSSGSAVAVATGYLPLAFGTDTSGSIRGPAALCGVVGMKPTFGQIPLGGAYPLAWSLDCCGPLTWTVADNATALAALVPVRRHSGRRGVGRSIAGMKVGVVINLFEGLESVDDEVLSALAQACDVLREGGASIGEVKLPQFDAFEACGRVIMGAESYAIHRRMLARSAPLYGAFAFQRIAAGALVSGADYLAAQQLRRKLANAVNALFERDGYDALLCGNNFACAPQFASTDEPISPPGVVRTIPFALSGHPVLAVPCGFSPQGLPIGAQVVAPYFREDAAYRIGSVIEAALGVRDRRPDLSESAVSSMQEESCR